MIPPILLSSFAVLLCSFSISTAWIPAPTTTSHFAKSTSDGIEGKVIAARTTSSQASTLGYKSTNSDEDEIDDADEFQTDKKIDPSPQKSLNNYHFTTKKNTELIFDERTGRFFETSIRPGSFHQLWQEYLKADDESDVNGNNNGDSTMITSAFSSNDMISTEMLFGTASSPSLEEQSVVLDEEQEECVIHTPYQDNCESTPLSVLDDDETSNSKKKKQEKINASKNGEWSPPTIVEECYNAWNRRDMKAAAKCFVPSSSLEYQDYQFLGKITSRQQLEEHFKQQAQLLPPNCQIVVDHLAFDEKGKIATQWHVERPDGSMVQFTKGVSFYTLDTESGLIQNGFRTSEMVVKPNRNAVNALLNLAPNMGSSEVLTTTSSSTSVEQTASCIVQEYFDAWNRRDMEAALEYWDDDCAYQTEDPVFVGTLKGKDALRKRLIQNANVLPAAAKIILDDLAVDSFKSGNIGTRWHLEVNGVALPNLQGCSMYTSDPSTGKIKTALDITEAPVKLPRQALPFLWAPVVAAFDWN